MKEFNKIESLKVKVQEQFITEYNKSIKQLKDILQAKYLEAQKWNF